MYRIILTIVTMCLFTHTQAQWLKTKAGNIVNEKNETIILRGMGLGGWMLQEGYMFRLSFLGQQYRIKEKISDVVGETKTTFFYEQWLLNHNTKADIDSLAAWGFNSVRLPMHYNLYTLPVEDEPVKGQHTWIEKGFALTDSLLNWCKANNLYLILDLHAAPGGQGNDLPISDRDPSKPALWESEANKEKTIALWRKLAERYANEPWIGGYDIINEPNWGFEDPKNDFRGTAEKKNEPLRELMIGITKAIREVDKKHIIIIEGNGFGNNYRGVLPPWDDNMVLSFHKYGNFNNEAAIKSFLELREQYKMPLWLGESGENSNTWFTEAIALAEKHGIGWAWWQMKKMGINNPLEIKRPAGYDH
ncbi:MAG: glycoside hydrolase family 5 protein, partial [Chitinophagaceae bacterium]|nr:glycoside hydrolase family 5 protein [Chitinophagaceae bacterium]